jgi:parallel beta-helix repeat protein
MYYAKHSKKISYWIVGTIVRFINKKGLKKQHKMKKKYLYSIVAVLFIFLMLFSGMASIWAENASDLENITLESNDTNMTATDSVSEVLEASDNTSEPDLLETPEITIASEKELKKAKIKDTDKLDKKLRKKLEKQLDSEIGVASDEEDKLSKRFLVYADSKKKAKELGKKNVNEIALVEDLELDDILELIDNNDVEYIMEEPLLDISNEDVIDIINSEDVNPLTVDGLALDGENRAVCLIDTGVDYTHEDLAGKIINGPDYVNDDSDSMDDNGHGTHIAGTILAIAPETKVIAVKVCNAAGGCGGFDMMQGAQWCTAHKEEYNITSLSISIGDYAEWTDANCPTWMDGTLGAANDADIFISAASGNEGFTNGINYPACSQYATSVGATTKSDGIAVSSNRGPNLDLLAPGAMIISTCLGGGTCMKSGTSMATPVVATSAMLLKRYYELAEVSKTNSEIKQLMKDTAFDIIGYKRVDLKAAVDEDELYDVEEPPISCSEISNLVSYLDFDEGDANDELGINSGTLNGPQAVSGISGGAFDFESNEQDYIEISDNPSLDMVSGLTLQAWVNPESYANWGMGIIDKSSFEGAGGNYRLSINYIENRASFRLKLKDQIIDKEITSTNAIPLNEWTHIAATYDNSSMKIYINGVLDTEKAVSGEMVIDNYNVRIGQYLGSNRYFDGVIDEVTIYSSALSASEINESYEIGANTKTLCVGGDGGILGTLDESDNLDEDLKQELINGVSGVSDLNISNRILIVAEDAESLEGLNVLETSDNFAVVNQEDFHNILSLAQNPDVEYIMEEPILNASNLDVVDIINSEDVNPLAVSGQALDGTGTSVCLIDTGIDYNHANLSGKIINGPDYVNDDSDSMDDNGHGTHIAGTILSIAPETKVIAVKVCNAAGGCGGFDMIQGVQWCNSHKDDYDIKAISVSIGDYGEHTSASCPTWMDGTLEWSYDNDIFVAAASGNEGYTNGVNYPACSPYTTSVGATTKSDGIAVSSNRGPELDLMAPGAMIVSTCLGGGTCMKSGTSMATPSVAASATVLKQYYELASTFKNNEEIEQLLKDTAFDIMGYKRVDLKAAVDVDELYNNYSEVCGTRFSEDTTLTEDINCVGYDKRDYAMNVNVSGVTLDCNGHTISGDGMYGVYAYKQNEFLDNVTIKNCKFQGFERGIYVQNVNETIVEDNDVDATLHGIIISGVPDYSVVSVKNNTVTGNTGSGLYFYRVKDSLIEDNFVDGGANGIYMSGFTNNTIKNNDIIGTTGTAMHVKPGKNNTIIGNNISEGNIGIRIFYQGADNSDNNIIDGNTIINNDWMGVWLYTASMGSAINNTIVRNNYLENNNQVGHGGWYNAEIKVGAKNTLVENNTIKNSNKLNAAGILTLWNHTTGTIIRNNTIENCTGNPGSVAAIRLWMSEDDIVENNTISDSIRGVYVWHSTGSVIRNNEIFGMSSSAISLSSKDGTGFEVYENNLHDNLYGIYFSDINHVDVHDNFITENDNAGIIYRGILDPAVYDDLRVYNNNIYNNTAMQVREEGNWGAREISYNNEGNYWGRDAGPCFDAANDSNKAWVTDSHCYLSISGWDLGGSEIPVQTKSSGGGSKKEIEEVPENLSAVEMIGYEVVEVSTPTSGELTGKVTLTIEDSAGTGNEDVPLGEDIVVGGFGQVVEKIYSSSITGGIVGTARESFSLNRLIEFLVGLFS